MMTPQRWRQIEDLYNKARENGRAVLEGVDPEIRHDVESMLSLASGGGILDQSADGLLSESTQSMMIAGSQLGPYRIEAILGQGGMGNVYRATDTRLGRAVAVKIAKETFGDRFEREARAIAALNHPHICTLFDVGPDYLVMELLEGQTLAARLTKGKLTMEETLRYGAQIAGALAAAHAKGITHRDLKPQNVMLTRSGAKVLDFGLAKSARDLTMSTASVEMGTPAYMAPEQRQGGACDARTDIYALGLLLFEMAHGKRPPQSSSIEHPQLAHVIEHCLAEDPEERWQAASDVRKELKWAAQQNASPAMPAQPIRFEVRLPGNVTLGSHLSVSPDGRKLIFTATGVQPGLWIHDLATVSEWRKLPATEGACSPFWSPDSKFVAFATANQIRKINISDGSAQTLCTSSGAAAGAWSPDGMIVFAGASGIRRISADGGEVTDLTTVDHARGETFHALPSFLPDGKHFIYRCDGPGDVAAMFAASLDARPADQQRQPILPGLGDPMYLNGNLLFLGGDTLMVQPFDATRLQLRGEAAPVAEHVAVYSVSAAGVLAYSNDRANAAITVVLNWSADLQPDMKH